MPELRYALRQLLKSPGFTIVAVLSLALGIGAGTAVFSLVNGVLLGSLPVPYPNELRWLQWSGAEAKVRSMTGSYRLVGDAAKPAGSANVAPSQGRRALVDAFTFPQYLALREGSAAFAATGGFTDLPNVNVRNRNAVFMANGLMVSDNFFDVLEIRPVVGRLFGAGDERQGAAPSVVISYEWWEREFALDPGVLGTALSLNGNPYVIVGVLPRSFRGVTLADNAGFYVTFSSQAALAGLRSLVSPDNWWVHLIARVKPGASDAGLQAGFDVLFAPHAQDRMKDPRIVVQSGHAGPTHAQSRYRTSLLTLLSVVGLVVFVACANLAGLSLVRSASRQPEYAVRAALGAGRWRLVRQSLCESLLLALAGGALGLLLSIWIKTGLAVLLIGPAKGLRFDTSLDYTVLGFAIATSLVAALLTGVLPALRSAQVRPASALRGSAMGAPTRLRWGKSLVVAQIALTLVLLVGAVLYVRTLCNLTGVDLGFDPEHLLLVQTNPRDSGVDGDKLVAFYERSLEALRKIPGVRSVSLAPVKLLSGAQMSGRFFTLPTHPEFEGREQAHKLIVDETFFETMEIPLLVGRNLSAGDGAGAPRVVVVNETFARTYFGKENPIGQILRIKSAGDVDWTVVGVCRDAKYTSVKTEPPPTIYDSFRQDTPGGVYFSVRTAVPPFSIVPAVRKIVTDLNPDLPLGEVTTQVEVRDQSIGQERTFALLVGSLAGLAVLLSAIGVYGLMAYGVARRTREIGVRMALGAQRTDISNPVLLDALKLSLVGVLLGLPAVLLLNRLIAAQLYGIEPTDPYVLAAGTVALFGLAALASWLPARRAALVDPMTALRSE